MKNNKKIIIFIITVLVFSSAGCSQSDNKEEYQENLKSGKDNSSMQDTPGRYSAQGRIVKIDQDGIHVQEGENVNTYKVDQARSSNYFLGEYVGINKLDGGTYDAVSDQYYDYTLRRTLNGDEIKRVTATVGEVGDDFITAITEMGDLKFNYPEGFNLNEGDQFIADYVENKDGNELLSFFDETSKINATVREVSRDTNGMLRVYGVGDDNREYDINVDAETITNFAHSTLKEGDKIVVYPEKTDGNIPAAVYAKLIVKRSE
ncbi:MAG: hypothetical protein K0Q47_1784 [Sedimentibacter sp.]|nr:hypothetical protein [Sedimentibacter sp.]